MDVAFKNKELKRCAEDPARGKRKLGAIMYLTYIVRLGQLSYVTCLEELREHSGIYHELKGRRKGQWACRLNRNWRLIFKPAEDPIPLTPHNAYDWSEIKSIIILEIIDYH